MESLSLILNTKLVADDVWRSTSGYDEVRRTADEALRLQRPQCRLWSALRRIVTKRRASTEKEVVNRSRLVAESTGD